MVPPLAPAHASVTENLIKLTNNPGSVQSFRNQCLRNYCGLSAIIHHTICKTSRITTEICISKNENIHIFTSIL